MTEIVWLPLAVVRAIHDEQLAEHGGGMGLRDLGLLESALSRPVNLAAYGTPDIADLAAAYGFGIARNHPFIDGNKRTAFVASALFLELNGRRFTASEVDAATTFLRLAAGDMSEAELAGWFRANSSFVTDR